MRRNRDFIGPAGMGGMVSLWGASSFIRSVQYGSIATATNNANATISAVVVENSVVHQLGILNSGTNIAPLDQISHVTTLNNATTVNYAANTAPAGGTNTVVFCVIEYAPGVIKSRQVISIAGTNTTITNVNPAKTVLVWNGLYTNSTYPNFDLVVTPTVTLQNSTNVLMTVSIGGYFTIYGRITVLEYF